MAWMVKATLSCLLRNEGLVALITAITPFDLSSAIAGSTETTGRGEVADGGVGVQRGTRARFLLAQEICKRLLPLLLLAL